MPEKTYSQGRFLYLPDDPKDGKAQVNGLHPEEIYGLLCEMRKMYWMDQFITESTGINIVLNDKDLSEVPCLMTLIDEKGKVQMLANRIPNWRIVYHIENAIIFWQKYLLERTGTINEQGKILLPGTVGRS
jgi:hypothetical protein